MWKRRIIGITISVVSLLFLLWFLWPRTFAQTMPGFHREGLTKIKASLSAMNLTEDRYLSIDPTSPEADALFEVLHSTRFQRILTLQDTRTITLAYEIRFLFSYEEGDRHSIYTVTFTGDPLVDVSGSDFHHRCYTPYGSDAFQQTLLDFLLAQEYATTH